ncbi:MAG TPA: hypothetical protein VFL47_04110, partial [Flavisolibacter sp.]|nr:hypothetical protein [Flavisolibacter sp.]
MYRQFAAILLFFAFALQAFHQNVLVLDYALNTAAFAKNCENKARPKMHCNGKCQLMKKLKEEEKKDQQNPERRLENKNVVVFCATGFTSMQVFSFKLSNSHISRYTNLYPQGITFAI